MNVPNRTAICPAGHHGAHDIIRDSRLFPLNDAIRLETKLNRRLRDQFQYNVLSHTRLDHLDHVVIGENLLSGKPFGPHRNREKKNEPFHTSTALSAARRHFLENNLMKCQPIPSCLRLRGHVSILQDTQTSGGALSLIWREKYV